MDMIGIDTIGADYGGLVKGASDLGTGIFNIVKERRAEADAQASDEASAKAAIEADQMAVDSLARALVSKEAVRRGGSKDEAEADAAAAEAAEASQDMAAASLSPAARAKRLAAAQQRVTAATKAVSSSSGATKLVAQHRLTAARATLTKAQAGGALVQQGQQGQSPVSQDSGDGFLSKKVVGPVRVWHALAGVGVAGVGAFLYHRKG